MDTGRTAKNKWKLSGLVVVGLSIWVAAFVSLALASLVVAFGRMEDDEGYAIFTGLRFVAMLVAGIGTSIYIYVGAIAPRPAQLHRNGLLLLLMLPELGCMTVSRWLAQARSDANIYIFAALGYSIRPFIVTLFIRLVKQKIYSLGPPAGPCTNLTGWANLLIAINFIGAFGGLVPLSIYREYLNIEQEDGGPPGGGDMGMGPTGQNETSGSNPPHVGPRPRRFLSAIEVNETGPTGGPTADEAEFGPDDVFEGITQASLVLLGMMYLAAMVVSTRYVSTALARLVQRSVRDDQLSKVRRIVIRHVIGMLSGFLADLTFIIATMVDLQGLLDDEASEDFVASTAYLLDASGDTIGVLFLSGIGVLLLGQGSPEVGDVSGELRGLMHAAVLTSRADTVFEGRVAKTRNMRCVASFPGKYLREWNELTWLCEQGDLSCACVFLPGSDPQQRFGRHVDCPDTPGRCWCHSLYGCVQPWGCLWFDVWRNNIEEAVSLGLNLVVVYFSGEAGQGRVLWDDLGGSNLWDGCGLGGSQKGEVAYLQKRGIDFLEEDLQAFKQSLPSTTPAPS